MSYDKAKAIQMIDSLKHENKESANFCVAAEDLRNALVLGLLCYTEHLMHWADVPECSNQDTKEYFSALHKIHSVLTEAGVFSRSEEP